MNFFAKEDAQDGGSEKSSDGGHENDDGISRLSHDAGLQSNQGDDEGDFAARHHADTDLNDGGPSILSDGKSAAQQLGDDGKRGNDHGCDQNVTGEQLQIEARADGEKEKWRQEFGDAADTGQQVPLRRI